MRYKLLGRSGLRVSELCLGTMTFGKDWSFGASKEESKQVFDAFVDAGGNFVDTANLYTKGTSERFLSEFMGEHRQEFVLGTKYTFNSRLDDPNGGGNHRKSMHQALEASLKRLSTDYIDLYWVHAWDFMTPIDEVMRGLDDLVRAGKVLYVGISNAPAWIISQANTLADLRGWSPFIGLQIEYSLIERTPERELLPMAKALDIAVTAWSPLGGGMLTGKYKRNTNKPKDARYAQVQRAWSEDLFINDKNFTIVEEVEKVASEIDCTPAQVAINWIRQRTSKSVVIPIIGARRFSQLQDNLAALDFELSDGQLARLDEISAVRLGFPYDFLNHDDVRLGLYGNTHPLIDNHRGG